MAFSEIITSVTGGVATGALAYLGIRYAANKSSEVSRAAAEVDQRKVDREQFEEFKRTYREEQVRISAQLDQTQSMFRSAIRYIRVLRRDMQRNNMDPPALPEDLEDALW